jgi:hypothetical protein
VLFRQSAAPQLTGGLTGVALEREYNGNTVQASNDLANVKAEMKAHASNSGMFTTSSGANDFAIAKADVIDQLALDANTQAIRNVKRGADQSVEAHGLVLDNAGLSAVGFAFSAAGEPVNTLKITPNTTANVVLTANSGTVTYNGSTQSVTGLASATGLLGDDVANNGGANASVSGRNAGTYTNAVSDTEQIEANYANVTKNNGTLTIDKAQLTLAAVADSRQYNGTNASSAAVAVTGLQGSDTVTVSQAFDSKNVGARTLVVNSGFSIADQNGGDNYTVSTQTASGTISQNTSANVVLTANSGTVEFNGSTQSVTGLASAIGLLGDDVANNGGVTASTSGRNAGTHTNTVFELGDVANNYENVTTQNGTLTIGKNTTANVVLTANSGTVTYTGGNQTVSGLAAIGLLGDDVANNGGASASVSGRNAGTYTNALSDTEQIEANYANVTKNNGALQIERRSLGVVGTAVADKPFDGQVSAVISRLGVLQGLVEGEDLGLSAQAVFSDPQPGVAKPVTVTYAAVNGVNGLASNYRIVSNPTLLQATIVPPPTNVTNTNLIAADISGPRVFVASVGNSGGATGTSGEDKAQSLSCSPSDLDGCDCSQESIAQPEVCVRAR